MKQKDSLKTILANENPLADSKFTDNVLPLPQVFSLTKTTNDIDLKLIQSLPLSKASGLDGVSAKRLKEAGPSFPASLTDIINLSCGEVIIIIIRKETLLVRFFSFFTGPVPPSSI